MPSREPGQAGVTDAALEADIAAFRTEMEHWNNPPRDAALTVRILADRTRDKERIEALQMRIEVRSRERHEQHRVSVTLPVWDKCPEDLCMADRALLEVPDGE